MGRYLGSSKISQDATSEPSSSQSVRLVYAGFLPVKPRPIRLGLLLTLLLMAPLASPLAGADSLKVATSDFGVLGLLHEVLSQRGNAADGPEATLLATGALTGVESSLRVSTATDPISQVNTQLTKVELRDSAAPEADHPRPYELLLDPETQPPGFPANLVDTMFGIENWDPLGGGDLLAIGINTYVIYVNFTSRNNGPQYENWTVGTFTGNLLSFTDFQPFENRIDLDGDGRDDIWVGLTIVGLLEQGTGWDLEYNSNPLVPDALWIRPTFQFRVRMLNYSEQSSMWNALESLEVTMMKGFAYNTDLGEDGDAYAFVIDSHFTQPPYDFRMSIGIERMEFDMVALGTSTAISLASALLGGLGVINSSGLTITSVTAPYTVLISNPNEPGDTRQTECDDGWYDPDTGYSAPPRQHRCRLGVGVGYIHYDVPNSEGGREVLEVAYIDASFHPIADSVLLPSEAEITLRNDNLGEDSLDTIEYYADRRADAFIHYYEDRSNFPEGDAEYGNVTDARLHLKGLPSGSMSQDEINALFTMLGAAPGSSDLPGKVPAERLSMMIGIKNFSRDNDDNVDDPTLPVNPAHPPNSMIVIALSEEIERLELIASVRRYGSDIDRSMTTIIITDMPKVLVISGSFELPAGGGIRVLYDDPSLDLFSQFFDNILLNLVEIVLDIGGIVQGLPMAIVSTAGESGGEVELESFNQLLFTSSAGLRQVESIGMLNLELGSSDFPYMASGDHILLGYDEDLDPVPGRVALESPLVPVSISMKVSNISNLKHRYDPVEDVREINFNGTGTAPLDIAFISYANSSLNNSNHQFAHISERPTSLSIIQTSENILYSADGPIGTITYAAYADQQSNAIRLEGLPSSFEILVGDTLGYIASEPIESVTVQISNSSSSKTMNGDHFYFWQNEHTGEADLSARLSNITSIIRRSPEEPGSSGALGNGHITVNRSSSEPFNVILRDDTPHLDPHLGLNATILIKPLPSKLSFDYPSDVDSSGVTVPTFGEDEGINALAFFLGDMVGFGATVSDLVSSITRDLGGGDAEGDVALGLDLNADSSFTFIADMEKGDAVDVSPDWMYGAAINIVDRTLLTFNYSAMPWLTNASQVSLQTILADGIISADEVETFTLITAANVLQAHELALAMADGHIGDAERQDLDESRLQQDGITLQNRRSWHLRTWMPDLPPVINNLGYQYSEPEGIPTWEFQLDLEDWTPSRSGMRFELNGVGDRDISLEISGLDNTFSRHATVRAQFTSDTSFTVPRAGIDMHYDIGEPLDYIHAVMIDRVNQQRFEILLKGVPRSANLAATIGDVLLLDFSVPEQWRNGSHSAEAVMIQMMRYVDEQWWPATAFMRDLPGEMHLAAQPSTRFDITEQTAFQGLYTLDYSSNTDSMDLYLEAAGRAIDSRSDILLIAENMPRVTQISTTDDWGARIVSSGTGIERLYIRQSNIPVMPGVHVKQIEIAGENLQSATIHVYGPQLYQMVVIDDITGGRILVTARAEVQLGGITWDARGVLIDAQATGFVPSGSSFGVNGIASDLSMLNSLTGGRAETTHIIVVEPFSSAILTIFATVVN